MIFSAWKGRVSVRTQKHRMDNKGKVFDMTADPGQYKDVSKKMPKYTAQLRQAIEKFKKEVVGELGEDNRPFVIGHRDYPYTQIPARDGIAHGNIKRSNKFPNCSYFYNWTNPDDKITWTAEVDADGLFDVEIHYACPKADVGSTFELTFNDTRLTGKIAVAHEVPQHGAEHDRVERTESYVKEFKVLKLGTMRLKKGKGELTLKATKIPGSQAMEFRLIMLTRKDG
jgi:hypothetical protein